MFAVVAYPVAVSEHISLLAVRVLHFLRKGQRFLLIDRGDPSKIAFYGVILIRHCKESQTVEGLLSEEVVVKRQLDTFALELHVHDRRRVAVVPHYQLCQTVGSARDMDVQGDTHEQDGQGKDHCCREKNAKDYLFAQLFHDCTSSSA